MWQTSGNGTNTAVEEVALPLLEVQGMGKAFPLCQYGFDEKVDKTVLVTTPSITPGIITIDTPIGVVVLKIEVGGVSYIKSLTDDAPQPGEFVEVNGKLNLVIKGATPNPDSQIIVITQPTTIKTDYVNPILFRAFWGLPIIASLSWTRSVEQHPSGSANLNVLQSGIAQVRSRFRKGNEVEFASIGFSVSSYNEKLLSTNEYPGGVYEVSISFTGKWNRPKYNKPVLYRGGAGSVTGVDNTPPVLLDPDCINPSSANKTETTATVAALAGKNGVSMSCVGSDWNVNIPSDAPRDATTSWNSEFQARLRQNGAIAFYSSPGAVKAVAANGGNYRVYSLPTIEVSPGGDFQHNDGRFGYAVEYPKVKVEGKFSAPKEASNREVTQQKSNSLNKPSWKQRKPVTLTSTNGDADIDQPPANTRYLKSLELTWDTSGPTKSEEITTTEDGLPTTRTVTTKGFLYTAKDIYHEATNSAPGYYQGNAGYYWYTVKQEVETFNYDGQTGYFLGTTTTGWQYLRFKTENPSEPETISADPNDKEAEDRLFMFRFERHPINGATSNFLEQHLDYYKDIPSAPLIEYKVCNKDGSSRPAFAEDPTYVSPMFVSVEMTQRNTFAWSPHPDNNSADAKDPDFVRLPDLTLGEETFRRKILKILPSQTTESEVNGFVFSSSLEKIPDRYSEYSSNFSASGPGFINSSEETKITTHDGRPPVATRKPPQLEKTEPDSASNDPTAAPNQSLFDYYLLTSGYSVNDPTNGSVSYPYAKTLSTVLLAARTDLKLRDAQESVSFGYTVPFDATIQEFDRNTVFTLFDTYSTRVLSAGNSVLIQGVENGELSPIPLITSPEGTRISAGINREIACSIASVAIKPATQPPKNPSQHVVITQVITKDVTLGSMLPSGLPTRRNF